MVSDAELVERLREFLRASDLSITTTTSIVRRRLQEHFGVDLSDRKAFIREQVDLFLGELSDNKEPDEEDEDQGRPGTEGELKEEDEGGGSGEVLGEDEEEEEEEEDDEEKSTEGSSKKKKSNKLSKEVKKRGGGFTKLCSLSPLLQDFVGESELARTEVVKRLWAYIHEKKLQDPNNRRKIISGPVSPVKSKQNNKKPKKERDGKWQRGGSSGLLVPLPLSDDLVQFFGTGENTLSRSDVVKRIWDYIKINNLQDPADKRNVICDEKLKELFKIDSFRGFTASKLLAPHFIKAKQ